MDGGKIKQQFHAILQIRKISDYSQIFCRFLYDFERVVVQFANF